jgi:hypothetical protein
MEICKFPKKFPKEDTVHFFGFEKFENLAGDFVFVDARVNLKALDSHYPGKKIVYYELEEPNRFCAGDPVFRRDDYGDEHFYKILSACPYTTEWLNKKQNNSKRVYVSVPFNPEHTPLPAEKIYDVNFVGGIHSTYILETIKTMSKFNYCYVGNTEWLSYKLWRNTKIAHKLFQYIPKFFKRKPKYITHKSVTYKEKLRLTSQSKITLVHTELSANARHVRNIQKTPDWESNKAFSHIPKKSFWNTIGNYLFQREYPIPQQKGRIFETAFCRSLMLCRKDPFGEIKRYFEEGKEFVYYEDGKLEEKIKEILANWDHYSIIAENAYRRAEREYTTKRFVENYLSPIK